MPTDDPRPDSRLSAQSTDEATSNDNVQQGPREHPGENSDSKVPYSVYTPSEKWFIVAISSIAAMFSSFTANIYLPAIPTIATVFHESTEKINLTVTVYMIMQGIAPMFWGTLSDRWGRRPMTLACLVVLSLSCVGLALVPTNAYYGLVLLRCLQATGSASTVALGAGMVADISSPEERGMFFGIWNIGPLVGPSLGPVIGGAIAENLGWRAIFWCVCIGSASCFVMILLLLPETFRPLVGNGSIQPPPLYRPLIPLLGRSHRIKPDYSTRAPRRKFANPLKLFLYPDVTLLLLFNAIVYAVFYGVTASISVLFQETYPFLNETDIGLCYLATGGGMLIGGVVNGKLLDREYQNIKTRMIRAAEKEMDPEKRINPEDVTKDENFPIERARMRLLPIAFVIFVTTCVGYGWALEKRTSIAGPLVLQIIMGWATIAFMNTTQTLIIDLVPLLSSSVTACNNLMRCSFGALFVSVVNLMLNRLGTGWTYVLFAGLCVFFSPVMAVSWYMGPKWRAQRRMRSVLA